MAAGIDFQLEGGDFKQVDGVVLDLKRGAAGAEVPLLARDQAALVGRVNGGEAKLLGALLAFAEFEANAAQRAGLVETKTDDLRTG